jgi:hypothetical protein
LGFKYAGGRFKKRIYFFGVWQAGIAQLARAKAFQALGRGFESRFPLHFLIGFLAIKQKTSFLFSSSIKKLIK